jgi:hypothetical protein
MRERERERETVNGNYVQEMAEEINETNTEFAVGVATASDI